MPRLPSRLAGPVLVATLVAVPPRPALAVDLETRVDGIEARLESLTRRVAALETLLKEGGQPSRSPAAMKGEPAWDLDDYTGLSPLRVLQRSFDRSTGRVDVLLDVVGPIPDEVAWAGTAPDRSVPLWVTADLGEGVVTDPVAMGLERGNRTTPGSRLHVRAQLDPRDAGRVRQIRIVHETAPASRTDSTAR